MINICMKSKKLFKFECTKNLLNFDNLVKVTKLIIILSEIHIRSLG